jgi:RNA polymerase primary sigma factor
MRHNPAAFELFMSKANRHQLLTPEDEIVLGRRVQAMVRLKASGKPQSEFTFQEKRIWSIGMRARDKMIESNYKLVAHIALKMFRGVHARSGTSGMDSMDLVQEGSIGLATAIEKYDPEKGYRFSTYAYWWIKQGICRAVQNQERTIRIPDHAHEAIRKAMKAESRILRETGVKPTLAQVAEAIKIDKDKLQAYLSSNQRTKSIEGKISGTSDSETAFADILADPRSMEEMEAEVCIFDLQGALDFLDAKQRDIVTLRYGIGTGEPLTLSELSKKYHISSERVRQICEQAMRKMRLKMTLGNNIVPSRIFKTA